MKPIRFVGILFLLCLLLLGCETVSEVDPEPADQIADDDVPDDDDVSDDDDSDVVTPGSIIVDYGDMADVVGQSMDHKQYFHDGTWHQHYGDGLMFGPSYDLATCDVTGDYSQLARALESLDTNAAQVAEAAGSLGGLIDAVSQLESVVMALMGLLESGQFIQVDYYFDTALSLADIVDKISRLFDDYLPPELGEFAGATYGPTAISSMMAMLRLGVVLYDPQQNAQENLARAEEVLENIHNTAWSDELGFYRFAPDDDRLMLYPNATMMLAYGRAYEFTKNTIYVDRMADIYEGIQGLRDEAGDHYHSPYSREEANAVDQDYTTLSSQNYLMIGLWLAWKATGDQHYLDDIDLILGWIESHLFVDDVLKHHWVNGRVADAENDLYDFCSGCNLQTLYILRIIEKEALTQ